MSKLIQLVFLLVIAFPIFKYEWIRFQQLHHVVQKEWLENERILDNELCFNAAQRLSHGQKVAHLCQRAEEENRVHPRHRAFQQWWRTSEYVALYHRVAGTWYVLIGVMLSVIALALYFATQYFLQINRERHYLEAMSSYVHKLTARQDDTMAQVHRRIKQRYY